MYNTNIKLSILALLISITWFVVSFILSKDLIGGAFHDYKYHEKYFFDFSNNFLDTFINYGKSDEVRNSPVFYVLFSQILKIVINTENLKYFNLVVILPIIYFFSRCLDLKFNKLDKNTKLFFISCIFLSPTISSLINYPYPLIWALSLFLISLYFFLKFEKFIEHKILNALLCIFSLSIASISLLIFQFLLFFFLSFLFRVQIY